jgi:hypothetical protein
MADQYTRTVCGGSPLAATEPVVGLLLGTMEAAKPTASTGAAAAAAAFPAMSAGFAVTVTHAEDVPVYADAAFQTARQAHVALHQAVYGSNVVVGWYRCVASKTKPTSMDEEDWSSPTPKDLLISQQLAREYATISTTEATEQASAVVHHGGPKPFLFALLLVEDSDDDTKTSAKSTSMDSTKNEEDIEEEDADALLPLQLFAVDTTDQVLVGLHPETTWTLATAIPERIAVERALRETPSNETSHRMSSSPLLASLAALAARRAIVERYVQAVHNGTVPWDGALLRRIQGLLLSAGVLSSSHGSTTPASANNGDGDEMTKGSEADATHVSSVMVSANDSTRGADDASMASADLALLLQQVSALATAVATVQEYTDNARAIHEDRQKQHSTFGGASSTMRPLGRALWSGAGTGAFF